MLSSPLYTTFLTAWKIGGWRGENTMVCFLGLDLFAGVFVCVCVGGVPSHFISLSISLTLLHLVHWTDKLTFCFHCKKGHTKIFRQHFFGKFKFLLLETILRCCAIICGKSGQDKIFYLDTLNNKINFDTD